MNDNERLILRAYELQNAHRADDLAELFAKGSRFEDVPLGASPKDHEEMKALWRATWDSISEFAMTPLSVITDERGGAVEFAMTGRQTGGFPGYSAVSGRSFSLKGAAVIRIEDGRIASWTDYWSTGDLERELGISRD